MNQETIISMSEYNQGTELLQRCDDDVYDVRGPELNSIESGLAEDVAVTPADHKPRQTPQQNKDTRGRRVYQMYFINNISGPKPEEYGSEPLVYDPQTRNGFIRTTMSILLVQVLFTTAVLVFVNTNENIRRRLRPFYMMIMISNMMVMMFVFYGMVCYAYGRRLPCNIVLLSIGTVAQTLFAAALTVHFRTMSIAIAAVATLCVVAMCFGLAFTAFDFTRYYIVVAGVMLALFVASLLLIVVNYLYPGTLTWLSIGLSFLITLAMVVTLIIELQMVLGGKSLEYGVDDYAFAAYSLYTSIIIIFLRLTVISDFFLR